MAIGLAAAVTLGIYGISTGGGGTQPDSAGTCAGTVRASGGSAVAPSSTRVLLIGDSLMKQASCSAARAMASSGVTTFRRAVGGTGLLGGNVDWVARAATLTQRLHPDVVVAEFVGDYLTPVAGPDGGYVPAKPSCASGRPLRKPDGLHLTPDGASVFGQTIARELTKALGLPIVPDPC